MLQGGKLFLCHLGQIQTHCDNKQSFMPTTGSGLAPEVTVLRAQLREEGTCCTEDGTQLSCFSQLEALTKGGIQSLLCWGRGSPGHPRK